MIEWSIDNVKTWPTIALLLLMSSGIFAAPAMAQEIVSPDTVYARVSLISDRLSQIYKRNLGNLSNIKVPRELDSRDYYPRHVFQRVLDVECQISALLNLNSLKAKPTGVIRIEKYTPVQVMALVKIINQRVGDVKSAVGLSPADKPSSKYKNKQPINVYVALDRVELLLRQLGAPSVQPPDVLQRAQMIVHLLSNLCKSYKCDDLSKRPVSGINLKRPIKVYQEVFKLIEVLNEVEKKLPSRIEGGVLAPKLETGLIIPDTVNKVVGIILADLIEMNRLNGKLTTLDIPRRMGHGSPIEVWREIDFARRLALNLAKKI